MVNILCIGISELKDGKHTMHRYFEINIEVAVEISRTRYFIFRSSLCLWFGLSVWFLSCDNTFVLVIIRMCMVSS